jgi:hypothetical protein
MQPDIQLLVAIARLRSFTPAEVAAHAGVRLSEARNFLEESPWVEVARPAGHDTNRPKRTIWHVIPEKCALLNKHIARINTESASSPVQDQATYCPSIEEIDKGISQLQDDSLTSEHKYKEARNLQMYLLAIEAEALNRQVATSAPLAKLRSKISEAQGRLIPYLRQEPSDIRNEQLNDCKAFRAALFDWAKPLPLKPEQHLGWQLGARNGKASPREQAEWLVTQTFSIPPDDAARQFLPALHALALKHELKNGPWESVQAALAEMLEGTLALPLGTTSLSAVSMLVLALNFPKLSAMLLRHLIGAPTLTYPTVEIRTHILAAMARMAGTTFAMGSDHNPAATACCYLLVTSGQDDNWDILAPAALCAKEADKSFLLQLVARKLLNLKQDRPNARESDAALMRNVAISLFQKGHAAAISSALESMMDERAGMNLLEKLIDSAYKAAQLADSDHRFHYLRPGNEIASLVPPHAELLLDFSHESQRSIADKLGDLLTKMAWSPRSKSTPLFSGAIHKYRYVN